MLYTTHEQIQELRAQDPRGRSSNSDLERVALMAVLDEAIAKVEVSDDLRDILETIASLL